jgi:acetyl-CoA acetyltransferase
MSDMLPECVASSQAMAEDQEYVAFTGVTKTGLSAILHRMYTEGFGARPEDVAMFAVRGHDNAVGCAHAQYPFKLSIERVMASSMEVDFASYLLVEIPPGKLAATDFPFLSSMIHSTLHPPRESVIGRA